MKVVIADTSPLNYLILIEQVELLRALYSEVWIPDVVAAELRDPDAPLKVAQWASRLPSWIQVQPTPASPKQFERLDDGERAAIVLAQAQSVPVLLLLDDADARQEAERLRIPCVGTLGVLRAAAIRELLSLPEVLARLSATNFRAPVALVEQLLVEDARRRATKTGHVRGK